MGKLSKNDLKRIRELRLKNQQKAKGQKDAMLTEKKQRKHVEDTNDERDDDEPKEDSLLQIMQRLQYSKTKAGLYAILQYPDRRKNVPTAGSEYSNYISKTYYEEEKSFTDESSIKKRLKVIECCLEFENNQDNLYVERYVCEDSTIRIDIGNEQLEYIEIKDGEYSIQSCENQEMLFCGEPIRKPMEIVPLEKALESVIGSPLDGLDEYFNLSKDDLFLIKIWMVACMHPDINVPLLYLCGGAGTGKSSMQKIIADLIDPSTRGLVNWDDSSLNDLSVILNRSYLVNFDNVSKVFAQKSDMLCQCVTGGNKSYRKKYTDSEEVNFNLRTRVAISSVQNCIHRDDLLSRTLFITVPKIKDRARIREDKFLPLYKRNRGQLTSELLSVLGKF